MRREMWEIEIPGRRRKTIVDLAYNLVVVNHWAEKNKNPCFSLSAQQSSRIEPSRLFISSCFVHPSPEYNVHLQFYSKAPDPSIYPYTAITLLFFFRHAEVDEILRRKGGSCSFHFIRGRFIGHNLPPKWRSSTSCRSYFLSRGVVSLFPFCCSPAGLAPFTRLI